MIEKKIIDLTREIRSDMMVFPGLSRPVFEWLATVEQEGYYLSKITLVSHTGTHIDAPKHYLKSGKPINEISLEKLIGDAIIVNVEKEPGSVITLSDFKGTENDIKEGDIVIINTGIYRRYGTPDFTNRYPTIDEEVIQKLIEKNIKAYGTDALSLDPLNSDEQNHLALFKKDIPIIENLANLGSITKTRFIFIALPLKVKDSEGAPCRAVGLL
ncbi:Kynurenine formamidase [subsurface metagenome]|nr:cyclase family protein [Hadesarchaea archaeon]